MAGRFAAEGATARHLRVVVVTLLAAGLAVLLAGAAFVWLGLYDVAATSKHSPPVEWLLHFVMRRSVVRHAPELPVPNLDDPNLILRGALHYASACAACHGAPGQLASPIAREMTPVPPGLYSARQDFDPSQLFWIVQHGVKLTAMPAWPAQTRSDEIWAMVAFLEHLPTLTTPAYLDLVGEERSGWLPAPPPSALGFDVARCARCHGDDGRGRGGAFPALARRSENELEAELREYRDGSVHSGFMQPVAAELSDAQIVAAARYYANLPAGAHP